MLNVGADSGNGFVFETYDSNGLYWAIGEAMKFYRLPPEVRDRQIARIMDAAGKRFNHDVTAAAYIATYEKMLNRPLIVNKNI